MGNAAAPAQRSSRLRRSRERLRSGVGAAGRELRGGQVPQRAVRPVVVVVLSPGVGQLPGRRQALKLLDRQEPGRPKFRRRSRCRRTRFMARRDVLIDRLTVRPQLPGAARFQYYLHLTPDSGPRQKGRYSAGVSILLCTTLAVWGIALLFSRYSWGKRADGRCRDRTLAAVSTTFGECNKEYYGVRS